MINMITIFSDNITIPCKATLVWVSDLSWLVMDLTRSYILIFPRMFDTAIKGSFTLRDL